MWEEFMRSLSRRAVLKQELAAALVPMLSLDSVIRHPVEAFNTYRSFMCIAGPTNAAGRVASEFEANVDGHLDNAGCRYSGFSPMPTLLRVGP